MIFPNDPPEARSFWMKNTVIPLDIIFIGPDKRILNIAHGTPYSLEPLPSAGPSINVLEIAGGPRRRTGHQAGRSGRMVSSVDTLPAVLGARRLIR